MLKYFLIAVLGLHIFTLSFLFYNLKKEWEPPKKGNLVKTPKGQTLQDQTLFYSFTNIFEEM